MTSLILIRWLFFLLLEQELNATQSFLEEFGGRRGPGNHHESVDPRLPFHGKTVITLPQTVPGVMEAAVKPSKSDATEQAVGPGELTKVRGGPPADKIKPLQLSGEVGEKDVFLLRPALEMAEAITLVQDKETACQRVT